jgi:hypothetical protein
LPLCGKRQRKGVHERRVVRLQLIGLLGHRQSARPFRRDHQPSHVVQRLGQFRLELQNLAVVRFGDAPFTLRERQVAEVKAESCVLWVGLEPVGGLPFRLRRLFHRGQRCVNTHDKFGRAPGGRHSSAICLQCLLETTS